MQTNNIFSCTWVGWYLVVHLFIINIIQLQGNKISHSYWLIQFRLLWGPLCGNNAFKPFYMWWVPFPPAGNMYLYKLKHVLSCYTVNQIIYLQTCILWNSPQATAKDRTQNCCRSQNNQCNSGTYAWKNNKIYVWTKHRIIIHLNARWLSTVCLYLYAMCTYYT